MENDNQRQTSAFHNSTNKGGGRPSKSASALHKKSSGIARWKARRFAKKYVVQNLAKKTILLSVSRRTNKTKQKIRKAGKTRIVQN